jgi:hypothetical protein
MGAAAVMHLVCNGTSEQSGNELAAVRWLLHSLRP